MNRSIEIMGGVSELLDKKNISSDTDMREYKEDFFEMSLGSIKAIAHHAMSILKQVEANDEKVKNNLTESWLQGKIAITEDYMRTIHDFVMFVSEDDDSTLAKKDRPGLWENIRKKREREGKKYRPAKPGDKDRPDPKQWERLTKSGICHNCQMSQAECCCNK